MTLLALWHLTYDGDGEDLTHIFRDPVAGDVALKVIDAEGSRWLDVQWTEERAEPYGYLTAITLHPEPEWVYPVKIKIRHA